MIYKLTANDGDIIKITEDGCLCFSIIGNPQEYSKYLEWVSQGNTPEPAEETDI